MVLCGIFGVVGWVRNECACVIVKKYNIWYLCGHGGLIWYMSGREEIWYNIVKHDNLYYDIVQFGMV